MSKNLKKTYLFEEASIPKVVFTLCIPTVISSLVMVVYGLADSYFVGMLNDQLQNAAVTLANPMLMLFNSVTALFGVGSSSLMSRAMGKKNYEQMKQCSATGIYLSIFTGILFTIVFTCFKSDILYLLGADSSTVNVTDDYLFWTFTLGAVPSIFNVVAAYLVRCEGSPIHASIGTMSGCLINILLDPLFVLESGFNMGVSGAGCATFISNCFASIYFLALFYRRRDESFVSMSLKNITLTRVMMKDIFATGLPAMLANLLTVTSQIVFNNVVSTYGSTAIAAMGIAFRIDTIPLNISQGLANGIMPVVGYNYASGNIKRMKKAFRFAISGAILFLSCVSLFYYFFSEIPIRMFINHPEVIKIGGRLLQGLCIALPFYSIDTVSVGLFQACGLGKITLCFTIARQLILQIPFIFLLDFLVPLYGVSYSYLCTEIILSICAIIVVRRFFISLNNCY